MLIFCRGDKRMNRKIISIFLIFCMLFTLLPAGVFAAEETPTSGDCADWMVAVLPGIITAIPKR